jgi:hypothetical protein
MNTRQIRLIITSAVILAMTAGSLAGADEVYSGGVTVDIDRDVNGYLWIEDATVNLLENAHIKNAEYYGDIYAVSGSVLNIYGGIIDNYLFVTTSYNDMPEAQVTIYGSQFAIDGAPVAEGTAEVFLQDQQLSGVYQNGTAFTHQVDCFSEGDFYLTVKLGWITSKPEMAVSPASLDFGQVKVGTTAQQTVTISNLGTANLSLQTVSFVQDSNPDFSYTPFQLPLTIEPTGSVDVTVIFAPTVEGEALGVLKITGDDEENPFADIVMTGAGIVPDIMVEPVSMDFGQWLTGTSAVNTFVITNQGDADLVVESLSWAAGGSDDFAISALPELPLTIAPDSFYELEVMYTPTTAGAAAATLEIASDDPDQPVVTIVVAGEGIAPVVTPYQQIKNMIAFYDEAVQNGTIQGVGRGNCAKSHVKTIKKALLVTKALIRCERTRCAIAVLKKLDKFTDGQSRPKDLITGSAVAELNTQIETLLESLNTDLKTKPKHKCR